MEKKYKLTEESINYCGKILYRIEALKDFANVKKGDKGGYVEKEDNLSQEGDCWISDNAKVYCNAKVCGNAQVFGKAEVCGKALVCGNAVVCDKVRVFDDAFVYDNAIVCGNAQVCGTAEIKNNSDYIIFKNWWSSGRHFTWTRNNNMWKVGCFYGTGKELIAKAYKDSELSGREYERVVNYVESMLRDTKYIRN